MLAGPPKPRLWEQVAAAFTARGYQSPWRSIARPAQLLPPLTESWLIWLFLAGRGAGKTRSAAEACAELMRRYPGCRVALIGATFADGRDTMVEGEAGLLACFHDSEFRGGTRPSAWNRSMGELFLANGSMAKVFSSEAPSKLRGPQHHVAWVDEIAVFQDAFLDRGQIDTTWSNMMLGLRLPAMPGWPADYAPRVLVTTTPRRVAILRVPPAVAVAEPHRAGLTQMAHDVVRVTKGTTHENVANLADVFIRAVVDPLRGTRLGRQELDAELLDDVQGAMLQQAWIDAARRRSDQVPVMAAKAIGVDPAMTVGESSDLTGIVAVGVDSYAEGYVFADRSGRYSPEEWAGAAWQLVVDEDADVVVVEDNAGGDMVESTLKAAWLRLMEQQRAKGNPALARPPIVRVTPTGVGQGKWMRAQPIALLYEQQPGRIHHVMPIEADGTGLRNPLDELEDQATSWTGDPKEPSPDRVDAAVHALTWLLFPGTRRKGKDKQAGPVAAQRWATTSGRR